MTDSLKMKKNSNRNGSQALFAYLKIILLQYFQSQQKETQSKQTLRVNNYEKYRDLIWIENRHLGVRLHIILLHGRQPSSCKKLFNSHKWFVKGQTTKMIPHSVFPTQPLLTVDNFTIWSNHYHQVSLSSCAGHILPSSPSPMTPAFENYDITFTHSCLSWFTGRPFLVPLLYYYVLIVGLIFKNAKPSA